jgi:hypothetical protein
LIGKKEKARANKNKKIIIMPRVCCLNGCPPANSSFDGGICGKRFYVPNWHFINVFAPLISLVGPILWLPLILSFTLINKMDKGFGLPFGLSSWWSNEEK